jgi:hypothetical protein
MKKLTLAVLALILTGFMSCKKDDVIDSNAPCNLASTNVPDELVGSWVNGYTSFTNIIDAYDGRILGTTWKSGRYLHMETNGKNAVLYVMGGSQFSEFATKAEGTVSINETAGTLSFNVCRAHYRAWSNGAKTVDRDASANEVENLTETLQFFYSFEFSGGTKWFQLRFDPNGSPTSFRKVD